LLARLNRIFGPYLLQPPPHLHEIYSQCSDPADREALDLILTLPVATLYDQFFETDFLRDMAVPDDASGLALALINALGSYSETGQAVPNGYIRGGMGTLTKLIAQTAQEQGVEIHTRQPVKRVQFKDGQALGIELVSGERVEAKIVVATADPKRTFLKLCDPADLPAGFLQKIERIQTASAGASLKLHCALSALPDYQVNESLSREELSRVTLIVAPDRAYRAATGQAAQQGEMPAAPMFAGFMPSVYDPSLAPAGNYTWSSYVVWVPTRLRRGSWAERKEEAVQMLFRNIDKYAPNFSRSVIDYRLFTPADLDERMLLTDGNIHHIDDLPSQLLWQRPLPELSDYRTPLRNFYLGGAGMHPGGEVNGGPGHNVAHVILGDLKKV
jgi:phytoene dehydrogenase-like protein